MDTAARLKRLLYLVPAVLARQGISATEMAKELDVDVATLRDDIELLSQVGPPTGAPDEFLLLTIDEQDDCIYADLPQGLTRPLRLTAAEAFSLTLGLRTLAGSGVRPYEDAVARLLAKIRAALGEASPELLALEQESVVDTEDHPKLALLSDLHWAIRDRRSLTAKYHSASRGLSEQRSIDPYALLNHRGTWYLVGRCHRHNTPRLFKVERLTNVVIHTDGPAFTVLSDFNLEAFRRDELFQPEATHPHIELRFDKALAYEVRTRFDPSRVQVLRDGSLQVSFENPLSDWLVNWILGFGSAVEVQTPAALGQKVAERAQSIAALHG